METMEHDKPRPRRSFTPEFKADIVVSDTGRRRRSRCARGCRGTHQLRLEIDQFVFLRSGWYFANDTVALAHTLERVFRVGGAGDGRIRLPIDAPG